MPKKPPLLRHLHVQALLIFSALALVLTWPLAAHFTTHVPGDGIDDPALAWNLWWIKARLVDQLNPDIFHADWMFHPIQINLGFYTLTPLNGLLSVPLQTSLTLIIASNLILLSSFVLGGFGAYLVAKHVVRGAVCRSADDTQHATRNMHHAALLAGIIYAFASSKLFYAALGQFNIASSQWVPFTVLYVLRTGESRSRSAALRNAGLAALFLTLQAWAELTYASFLLIFIGVYFIYLVIGSFADRRIPSPPHPLTPSPLHHLPPFLTMGILFMVGIAPFLWAMLPDMGAEGDFFASGGGFADVFSADLVGYLIPTRLHPVLGEWVAGLAFPNDKAQHIFIGYSALVLAGMGAWSFRKWRAGWFWITSTLLFWLLTLGPTVRVLGQDTGIPGPFALVSLLPFFSGNRYPSRYAVMLMLCVALLAALGFMALTRHRRPASRLLASLLAALFLLEHLAAPLPINDSRVPPIFQQIAQTPGDFAVLELPTGWRNGARVLGKSDLVIMMQQWYQTEHGKRRLGGNTSRNPGYKFDYFTDAPLVGDLIPLMNADQPHLAQVIDPTLDEMIARNRAIAPAVLDFLGVRFITLDMARSPAQLVRFVEEALPVTLVDTWTGTDWAGAPAALRLYRVDLPAAAGWEVDLAEEAGRLHLAEGWSTLADDVRYATRTRPALLLDLPDEGGVLTLQTYGPAPLQGVTLAGQDLIFVKTEDGAGYALVEIRVPPGLADQPVDRLVLDFGQITPTLAQAPASTPVGETGAFLVGTSVVVLSAGEEVGDYGQILINGVDAALGRRGYNLVALEPNGEVAGSAVFDTLAGAEESARMAAWLDQWPAGTLIAGAVNDEASLNLGQDAVDALGRVGVITDLRGRFRWSHAFVGMAGAAPGTAVESAQLLHPARIFLGFPADAPQISGGVGRLRFDPQP